MAVKLGKGVGAPSVLDVFTSFQKKHGDSIGAFGGYAQSSERLPTGLFPLDLALGGGLPRGKVTTIFGPESSGKTNIALCCIRMAQLLYPEQICVFLSIEGFDPEWAKVMGVDVDKLLVVQPSYAEQVIDFAAKFLSAADCSLVVLDSIAAMISTQELEKGGDGAIVGSSAIVVNRLVRATTQALSESEKIGHFPTLLYINQIRHKIGVMYGSPETTPGGMGPLFQSSVRLRVYGKNVTDPKISKVLPIMKDISFQLPKNKCPIVAASGAVQMITVAHNGFRPGDCDDWNTIASYLKNLGMLGKKEKGQGWLMFDKEYHKLEDCEGAIRDDPVFGNHVRKTIIDQMLNSGQLLDAVE
jgi:recombination protein RecA